MVFHFYWYNLYQHVPVSCSKLLMCIKLCQIKINLSSVPAVLRICMIVKSDISLVVTTVTFYFVAALGRAWKIWIRQQKRPNHATLIAGILRENYDNW